MKREFPLHAMDVHCHGTYAWDLGDRVKSLGEINRDRAAELLHIPLELRAAEYMWLNKCWIVEGRAYRVRDRWINNGPDFDISHSNLAIGDRLIYLADGSYYRIEVVR